jgi:hypothetical protein
VVEPGSLGFLAVGCGRAVLEMRRLCEAVGVEIGGGDKAGGEDIAVNRVR